jgi:DNA-directed RNA polymerase specialized sigma subunit
VRGGQDTLKDLENLVAERAAATRELDERERALVKEAREQQVGGYYSYGGVPWADIAKALGVSRQAVMKRHAAALEAQEREAGVTGWDAKHRRRYDAARP